MVTGSSRSTRTRFARRRLSLRARADIRREATSYLDQVFASLASARVLPRSRYEPWLRVGEDYEGFLAMAHERRLAAAIERAAPSRFASSSGPRREFGSSWAFGLLHASIAVATRADEPYESHSPSIQAAIDELLTELEKPPSIRVAHVVSDIDLSAAPKNARGQAELNVGDVRLVDVGNNSERELDRLVPGSGFLVDRLDAFAFPGETAVVSCDAVGWETASDLAAVADARIHRFLTALRVVTGTSAHSLVVAWGHPSVVSPMSCTVQPMRHAGAMRILYRPAALDRHLASRLSRLANGDLARVLTRGKTDTDLQFAIARLNRASTDHTLGALDRLLELSIGLEAALSGPGRSDVGLRLRMRSAAFLATNDDPPGVLEAAVKTLYDLRSAIVHGDPRAVPELLKSFPKVRTAVRSELEGEQMRVVFDRFSDLLRRAIAVRIALGSGIDPSWPWEGGASALDIHLVTGNYLTLMRRQSNAYWVRRGLASAIRPAPPPSGLIGARAAPTTSAVAPPLPS